MSLLVPSVGYKPFRYPWAYDAWLKQQQMHWLPDEVPLTDDVRDWQTRLTPQEKNLLTQIFRFFTQADVSVAENYVHNYLPLFKPTEIIMMLTAFANSECFDDKTELLTSEGWIDCPSITEKHKIAQYNIKTGSLEFVLPLKVVSYPHNGPMHLYENETTNICVTPNHDLILRNPHTGVVRKKKSFEGKWGRNFFYPTAAESKVGRNLSSLERLLISVAADGCLLALCPSAPDTRRDVSVKFSKHRKIERMRNLLTENNIPWKEAKDPSYCPQYAEQTIFYFKLPDSVDLFNVKNLAFLDLNQFSKEGAKEALDELLLWDGSTSGANDAFYSTNRQAIDKVQALAVLAGLTATISINRSEGYTAVLPNGKITNNTKTCWVVTFVNRSWRIYPHRKEVHYEGKIYCVSVPEQNIVSRRKGKIAITGNTTHVQAYSHLLDTVGMPESEYTTFMKVKEMKDKYDYFSNFSVKNPREVAKTLAGFGAFTEGLQLFASFAMLLNFSRFGKMRGMSQIIAWSVRDETLHCENIIKLFHAFCEEHPRLFNKALQKEITDICVVIVEHEDAFIDLAFELGPVEGMTADEVKQYIRFIADRRLLQLRLAPIYGVKDNPLPWLDEILNAPEFTNFFENRSTEYNRASTEGSWNDVF